MNEKFTLGEIIVERESNTVIIAEAAVEHLGSLNVAKKMADTAKEIGVDIIKYQMHIPESEMLANKINFWGGSLDNILQNYNISISDHRDLIKHCAEIGIQYLCTPFCAEAVRVLDDLGVDGFKTGSGELRNIPLLEAIVNTRKPVIVSTGMSTMDEIRSTVEYLKINNTEFMLTNCTSIYPTPYNSVNLELIRDMSKRFKVWVGHSDHTPDLYTCLGAVGMGAKLIEKHFTLSRFLNGPDSAVSLEPKEMRDMVKGIRIIDEARGFSEKVVLKEEENVRKWAHHSVVSLVKIKKGELIGSKQVGVKRPGTGIPAIELANVVGSCALIDIPANSIIKMSDIKK